MWHGVRYWSSSIPVHSTSFRDDLPLLGELAYAVLVAAQGQSLVQAALELAAQFTQCPVLVGGFDFIKAAFINAAYEGKA